MASEALAQRAVENVVKESRESGTEPPTAITGNGTTDSPYDGGNSPETATQPGIEPLLEQKGADTAADPSDQGNALEQDQIPGGKLEPSEPTGFPERQGSGAPQAEPNVEEAQAVTASENMLEHTDGEAADKFQEATTSAAVGGNADTAKAGPAQEAKRKVSRDVSPGTLPDGSHAKTAEARGEVYEASKMSKFKNKLGFGKG